MSVTFFYVRENSRDLLGFVDADIGLYGKCTAHTDGGFWHGDGECNTKLKARMLVYQSWEKPPLPTIFGESNEVDVLDLEALNSGRSPAKLPLNKFLSFPIL